MTSISTWRRECEQSLQESRERRRFNPHPWPESWRQIMLAAFFVLIAWGLTVGAWAIA